MSNLVSPGSHPWQVVYTTHNLPEAHIVAGRLDFEGIPAMIHHQAGRSALGIQIGRLGEIHVVVRAEDAAKALAVLDPATPDELPDSTDAVTFKLDQQKAADDEQ